jgi:hypothetical protein
MAGCLLLKRTFSGGDSGLFLADKRHDLSKEQFIAIVRPYFNGPIVDQECGRCWQFWRLFNISPSTFKCIIEVHKKLWKSAGEGK